MNVIFLTMLKTNIEQRYIYSDLMRRFRNEGHEVYIVMPSERREGKPTTLDNEWCPCIECAHAECAEDKRDREGLGAGVIGTAVQACHKETLQGREV